MRKRKKAIVCGSLLLFLALALVLGGCERAKPEPKPTATVQLSPTTAMETPATTPEPSVSPSPSPEEEIPTPLPLEPTATSSPSQPAAPSEGVEYVVRWGDTIYVIADRFGVSAQDIVAANNLANPDLIRAGDVLIIPGATASPSAEPGVHIVRRGENLNSIAQMYGTTVDAICRANGIVNPNYIWVGQRLTIPGGTSAPASGRTYVVQTGDTLSSIAVRFGTTAWAIAYANNLPNVNFIYVGQTLNIP
jgi:LysM repeat protein